MNWLNFKSQVSALSLIIKMVDAQDCYLLSAYDGPHEMNCRIKKANPTPFSGDGIALPAETPSSDQLDFETNFKNNANLKIGNEVTKVPAFASKNFGTKSLFKRVVGKRYDVSIGDNTLLYTETFTWVKFMALEIINGEVGDTVSLYVLDTATGTFSTVPNYPLNQFGFEANIAAGFYEHKSEFDADIYAGLQIKIVYHSISAKAIGVNYVMNEVK